MSLFQCEFCGCIENTALSSQGFKGAFERYFDWSYAPDRQGKLLCSACGPTRYSDSSPTKFGKWHDAFPRDYLPKGEYETCERGNLKHKKTGQPPTEADYVTPPSLM